jgi:S1-C subfamily serine protease
MPLALRAVLVVGGMVALGSLVAAGPSAGVRPSGAPLPAASAGGKKADPKSLEPLLKQGREALAAGEYKAARDAFSDAAAIDQRNVEALHGEGLAYMYLNDFAHALAPMERAMTANPAPSRALVLNMAVCQIGNKNPMRAGTLAMDYLSAHPGQLDEPLLNAMGTALFLADDQAKKGRKFTECEGFYKSYQQKLEAAKPGMKRWGTQWIAAATVDERNTANAAAEKQLASLNREIASLEGRIGEQSREVEKQKDLFRRGFGTQYQVNEAVSTLKSLTDQRDEKQQQAQEAGEKLLRPQFPRTMALVAIDDLKPPPVGASGVNTAVAVAEDPQPAAAKAQEQPREQLRQAVVRPAQKQGTGSGNTAGKSAGPKGQQKQASDDDVPLIQVAVAKPTAAARQRVHISSYAAAFPVSDSLVLTASGPLAGATEIQIQSADGTPVRAALVRADEQSGLALIRVEGRKLVPMALGSSFGGGAVQCASFPTVNIFNPAAETIAGTAKAPAASDWKVTLQRHPRLGGAPLLAGNKVIGVELAGRESDAAQIPAATLEQVKAFLGADLPAPAAVGPEPTAAMLQVIATRESAGA